ncbi:MAG: carboxymuconolactone decarboxylase family protein [Candidatus Wallbacteria bacterium]|nr:carboxymuconolactone decarboxylase family protein [Candidatus Wallbacteria bacterium]
MSWITEIQPSEAPVRLKETYKRLLGDQASAPAILAVSGVHPEGMEGHMALYKALMFGGSPLTRRQREMIAVVVSQANDCHY